MKNELDNKNQNQSSTSNERVDNDVVIDENSHDCEELSDDIEVMGPGQMLSEARIIKSLTQEQVAKRLNFCTTLVTAIENDDFDEKLPATFNRGYLRNYAKLVGISPEDIIASYESLGAAEIQRTEMQSFSNTTAKQAEHSRLMWISYLIIAILFASTIMWWIQGEQDQKNKKELSQGVQKVEEPINNAIDSTKAKNTELQSTEPQSTSTQSNKTESTRENVTPLQSAEIVQATENNTLTSQSDNSNLVAHAVFTFSGDCWVNIYDANNERIAWGIKKSGYVMTVEGKGPFKVTLGKPELASIVFNGESIDMAQFNVGNIAKFTLPVVVEN